MAEGFLPGRFRCSLTGTGARRLAARFTSNEGLHNCSVRLRESQSSTINRDFLGSMIFERCTHAHRLRPTRSGSQAVCMLVLGFA